MPRRTSVHQADSQSTCTMCGGTGQVPDPDDPRNHQPPGLGSMIPCPLCGGMGRIGAGQANPEAATAYRRRMAAARVRGTSEGT